MCSQCILQPQLTGQEWSLKYARTLHKLEKQTVDLKKNPKAKKIKTKQKQNKKRQKQQKQKQNKQKSNLRKQTNKQVPPSPQKNTKDKNKLKGLWYDLI